MRTFRFKFWEGTVVIAHGKTVREALVNAGLGAYNPVAYDVEEITE